MSRPIYFVAFFVMPLTGCMQAIAPVPDVKQEIADRQQAEYEKDLQAKAFADKRASAAKGTKNCYIKQYTSAYKAKALWPRHDNPYTYVYSSKLSNIHFKVNRDGSIGVAVTDDTYPGMRSFFLIDGKRYSAEGDHYATVTSALPALKRDVEIKYAWHNWPYRSEINDSDAFAGFAAAYDECVAFLKGS